MGNCAGSPKTKADHDAVPAPEPAKEESLAMTTNEEAKLQPQEKKDVNVGHQDEKQIIDAAHNVNSLHENNAPSLGSFLVENEEKKEAKENEKTTEVIPSETKEEEKAKTEEAKEEEKPKTVAKEEEEPKTVEAKVEEKPKTVETKVEEKPKTVEVKVEEKPKTVEAKVEAKATNIKAFEAAVDAKAEKSERK